MTVKKLLISTGLLTMLMFAWSTQARAVHQPVTFWNNVAVTAATAGRPGVPGLLDIALVQAAVHDAVQAIEGRYEPYLFSDPSATGSPQAAVAAAAYGVLAQLYPLQRPGPAGLDQIFSNYVTSNGLTGNPALDVGADAADALFAVYRPTIQLPQNPGVDEIGQWRSTPPANLVGQFEFLGHSEPFTLVRTSQFRPEPPPPMTSKQYLREYNEVKAMGSSASTDRSAAQTDLAYFWSDNFVAQWNRALRGIADNMTDIGDSARLFALAGFAAADTSMTVWECKFHYNFWRPITAIREGDNDPNPGTEGDPSWTPLIATPPYPDYSSGANGLTGAYTTILRQFFGTDEYNFTVTSNASLAIVKSRDYSRFSEAADQVVEARILLGIHFRSADVEARQQGSRVAHWVFQKFLRPASGSK